MHIIYMAEFMRENEAPAADYCVGCAPLVKGKCCQFFAWCMICMLACASSWPVVDITNLRSIYVEVCALSTSCNYDPSIMHRIPYIIVLLVIVQSHYYIYDIMGFTAWQSREMEDDFYVLHEQSSEQSSSITIRPYTIFWHSNKTKEKCPGAHPTN